jgi:hypothetical protein
LTSSEITTPNQVVVDIEMSADSEPHLAVLSSQTPAEKTERIPDTVTDSGKAEESAKKEESDASVTTSTPKVPINRSNRIPPSEPPAEPKGTDTPAVDPEVTEKERKAKLLRERMARELNEKANKEKEKKKPATAKPAGSNYPKGHRFKNWEKK